MQRRVEVNGRVPKPALKPYPNFNADHDAEVLKKAMDGLENLDSELSGDFGELVDLLFFTPAQLKAEICYKAIRGLGTDEDALIEVICTSNTEELKELKEEYAKGALN
ncbi:unnamed protein product [Dibothriocephalus latus]|uniref:Annexin n=1 Tax=Dibothriocephalus latus TaxID=60516 RepID=A0A3P7P1F2_DIBLA|nr:unnamed protein product [Dibothriocephalus latus]